MMGRRLIFETPEQMQEVIDNYFDDCKANRMFNIMLNSKNPIEPPKNTITDDEYPTVSGLALCLGMSRQSLINYEEKDLFLDTVKRAKTRIESTLEQRLYHPQPTGVIFNLKNNYGWKDSSEIDHRSGDNSMTPKSAITISKNIDAKEAADLYREMMQQE